MAYNSVPPQSHLDAVTDTTPQMINQFTYNCVAGA